MESRCGLDSEGTLSRGLEHEIGRDEFIYSGPLCQNVGFNIPARNPRDNTNLPLGQLLKILEGGHLGGSVD